MPYSEKQCRAFAMKAKRGERVPKDWKKYCRRDKVVHAMMKKK